MPSSPLLDWLDEWDLVLRSGTLARNSRYLYVLGARQFIEWATTVHPDLAEPGDITPRHAHTWAEYLKDTRRLANSTRALRLLAARLWLDYVAKQAGSGLVANPFAGVELPTPDQVPPDTVPDAELAALIATCKGGEFVDLRDEAIIRLLFNCGVRSGELRNLGLDDVDLAKQEVKVTGKTGTRLAPYDTKTALALRRYLRARARRLATAQVVTPALFVAYRMTRRSGASRLSADGLCYIVYQRCDRAGIPRRRPHHLRHTWADDMLASGLQEGDLARLGGWSPNSRMPRWYGSANADRRARDAARTLSRGDRV
ncbi:tyrosine-type recombinase/integrase [Saccharothrix stipae]